MKNQVVGALVVGVVAAFVASACGSKERSFGTDGKAGGQGNAGTSGSGPERGGSHANGGSPASGGRPSTAGMAGDGVVVGGSSAEGGAGGASGGGDAGGTCQGADCATCVGASPAPGTQCGECGKYVCNPDKVTTSCADPKHNACGGCAELVAAPGAACGSCGKYECAADKESVKCNDPGKNACGGCGTLASAPNSSCGSCGNWVCTADKTSVQCSGVNANACGGCGTLANAPGAACGQCGKYACSADKASTTCSDPGKNACGGCTVLTGTLNAACGTTGCGKLTCSADKESLTCTGDVANACGGCNSTLTPAGATKDASCGTCGRTWACNADKNSLSCAGTMPNVCGGCTAITGSVGAACGACSVTACSTDKNSLVCNSQCTASQVCVQGLNQCKTPDCSASNSCGMSDGAGGICTNTKGKCPAKPNATGSCSGSSCVYVCQSSHFAGTLSCSTPSEPACGSWDFESNTPEGWYVNTAAGGNAASGAVFATTPPGTGAGSHSLAVNIDGTKANASYVTLSVNLCPGSAAATGIAGAFHVSVWFKPTDANGAPSGPGYTYLSNGSNTVVGGGDYNTPANTWFDIPSSYVMSVSVSRVDVSVGGLDGHKGVLYIDNAYFD